jgi:hypothetical protein
VFHQITLVLGTEGTQGTKHKVLLSLNLRPYSYQIIKPRELATSSKIRYDSNLSKFKFWSDKAMLCQPKLRFGSPGTEILDLLSILEQ